VNKKIVGLTLMILLSTVGLAAAEEVQVALIDPVQFVSRDRSIDLFRLNLIAGVNDNMRGLDLGLFNITRQDFDGIGLGLSHYEGGHMNGWQLGVLSIAGGDVEGVQTAAISTANGFVHGWQMGLVNYAGGGLLGLQTGAVNIVKGDGKNCFQLGLVN